MLLIFIKYMEANMLKMIKKIIVVSMICMMTFVCVACKKKDIDIHYDELPTNESIDYAPTSDIKDLPTPKEQKSTEEVIHDIIIDYNKKLYSGGKVQACGYLILDEEDIDPLTRRVTGFVSYGEYNEEGGYAIKLSGSGEIPTAITYSLSDPANYSYEEILTENNFEKEVKDMFKEKDWDKVFRRDEKDMERIRKMELREAENLLDIKR